MKETIESNEKKKLCMSVKLSTVNGNAVKFSYPADDSVAMKVIQNAHDMQYMDEWIKSGQFEGKKSIVFVNFSNCVTMNVDPVYQ